jgi:hypothetical protein
MGHRVTLDFLKDIEKAINEGGTGIDSFASHVHSLPPAWRLVHAELEKAQDGEWELYGIREPFENVGTVTLQSGQVLVKQKTNDRRPPKSETRYPSERIVVELEERFFESTSELERFRNELKSEKFASLNTRREKGIPIDPNVVIIVGTAILKPIYDELLKRRTKPIVDKIDTAADATIKLIGSRIRSVIARTASKNKTMKPLTSIIKLTYDPLVELVHKDNDADWLSKVLTPEALYPVLDNAEQLKQEVGAVIVQYHYDEETASWKFCYSENKDGELFSEEVWLARRDKLRDELDEQERLGGSVGFSGVYVRKNPDDDDGGQFK